MCNKLKHKSVMHETKYCPEESYKAILDNKKVMQYFVIKENTLGSSIQYPRNETPHILKY